MKIKKAIIPVAGLGTRFLPATKTIPKEMLPIVDKPCIQYIIEEAVNSGITDIILINRKGKQSIEDHFDKGFEIETHLKSRNKNAELKTLRKIEKLANFIYIRQDKPLGDGHAILKALPLVCHEPFAVLFGDDVFDPEKPVLKKMIASYNKTKCPVIALQKIEKKDSEKYGIIESKGNNNDLHEISKLVEKPKPEKAPSDLGICGKYIVTPELLKTLATIKKKEGEEIRIIDGMKKYVEKEGNKIYGLQLHEERFDTGSKFGLLKASIHFGLKNPQTKEELKKYIKSLEL